MTARHLYDVLGVEPTASADQIKTAYRALQKVHHPDAGGDPEVAQRVNEAYRILGSPTRRAEYDRSRVTPEPPTQARPAYGAPPQPTPTTPRYVPPRRVVDPRARRRRIRLLGAAGAVIALALAVSAVFGTSTSAETRAVTAAAKGAARALYDYDYRHLDDFENHVVAASTPEFATTFRTQFREGLAKVIADSEETSITTRVSVTVHSVSASAARTTLLIDATQRAGVSSPAEPRNFHVEVRFIYEHKRWLISGVSTLAPPADVTGFR